MKIALVALTKNGSKLALEIAPQFNADVFVNIKIHQQLQLVEEADNNFIKTFDADFKSLIASIFDKYDAFIFIMACGIVIRSISPFLKDKTVDPAVVVMDEKGQFAISLLSGHIGGANKLAKDISLKMGCIPVITTATDINNVIAFDVFAKDNNCIIENIHNLKYISSELVNGSSVGLFKDDNIRGSFPKNIVVYKNEYDFHMKHNVILSNRTNVLFDDKTDLLIRPKNLILGFGCKKGISKECIKNAILHFMKINNKSLFSLKCIATIDLKAKEPGLIDFCNEYNLQLCVVALDDIKKVEKNYTESMFVKKTIGVGSVAEPCSQLAFDKANLICKRMVFQGITLALSEKEMDVLI